VDLCCRVSRLDSCWKTLQIAPKQPVLSDVCCPFTNAHTPGGISHTCPCCREVKGRAKGMLWCGSQVFRVCWSERMRVSEGRIPTGPTGLPACHQGSPCLRASSPPPPPASSVLLESTAPPSAGAAGGLRRGTHYAAPMQTARPPVRTHDGMPRRTLAMWSLNFSADSNAASAPCWISRLCSSLSHFMSL
jgi:hypothetical protein